MCGIVAVISDLPVQQRIVEGLKKVQYRGYDSAGVCFKESDGLSVSKTKGSIKDLEAKLLPTNSNIAIGHTRWATHGKVCENNAHPILSSNKAWAVVHNGIIENYKDLVNNLILDGEKFFTSTDTEVIPALLETNNFSDEKRKLAWVCKQLKGSYAFCCLNKKGSAIFAAKNKSPLYAFCDGKTSMFASDPICFPKGDYYKFEDGEMCKMTAKKLEFFDMSGQNVQKTPIKYQNLDESTDKNGFEHYMLKEIYQTPDVLKKQAFEFLNMDTTLLKKLKFDRVKLVGCGTAYHACMMGREFVKRFLGLDAEAVQASEFRYGKQIVDRKTLCIFVSQSGETADTIAALELAQKKRAKTLVLTNVPYSTLSRMGQINLCTYAGREICVASTKAYTCQVAALYILTMIFKGEKYYYKSIQQVQKLAEQMESFFVNISPFGEDISKCQNVFFIGKGMDYITALEGALKLKEISYINCNAFPSGELKHGVLALVDDKTPIIVISTNEKLYDKTMNSALEAKSRGAKIYLISTTLPQEYELKDFEMCLTLPRVAKPLSCLMAILPLQLLSYNVSLLKGVNPDMPRNLAKSVTVE